MANSTSITVPPLPHYELRPLPPLVSAIPDKYLSLVLPIAAYWTVSLIFHLIDTADLFPQYRLHTPKEIMQRNHASRWEVFRDVILQQVIQTAFGLVLGYIEPDALYGAENYNVAVWAQRIRRSQVAVPTMLTALGVNSPALTAKSELSVPALSGLLAGGRYPWLVHTFVENGKAVVTPTFAEWEMFLARTIFWVLIPAMQFMLAFLILDTWQYFWHRAMHLNKWLYVKFHSRHHRLYVPYAYGALYNHPLEGFLLDTLGAGIAYLLTGMTVRQAMCFFTFSTIKTVDDHCGYALPWDPLQHISSNNAAYHDIHHQSWGIKTNFSQPFFTIWDRLLDTKWTGDNLPGKYEKARKAAEKKYEAEVEKTSKDVGQSTSAKGPNNFKSEKLSMPSFRLSMRKRSTSSLQHAGGLKGLSERFQSGLYSRGSSILGLESH